MAFLADLLERLDNLLVVDRDRLYVTGFSRGGLMAQALACRLAQRLAGAAPVAGTMPESVEDQCTPLRRISMLMVHGTRDQSVPFDGDPARGLLSVPASIRRWAVRNGCDTVPRVSFVVAVPTSSFAARREDFPRCGGSVATVLYALEDVGHQWATPGFPTERVVAEFLLAHQR